MALNFVYELYNTIYYNKPRHSDNKNLRSTFLMDVIKDQKTIPFEAGGEWNFSLTSAHLSSLSLLITHGINVDYKLIGRMLNPENPLSKLNNDQIKFDLKVSDITMMDEALTCSAYNSCN
jgi:hypothetical protein